MHFESCPFPYFCFVLLSMLLNRPRKTLFGLKCCFHVGSILQFVPLLTWVDLISSEIWCNSSICKARAFYYDWNEIICLFMQRILVFVLFCCLFTCVVIYEVGWLSLRLWFPESYCIDDKGSDVRFTAKLEVQVHTRRSHSDVSFRIVV